MPGMVGTDGGSPIENGISPIENGVSPIKNGKSPSRLKTGILWGLVFLAAYGLVAFEARQKGEKGSVRATTYSASRGGYKALYLWLRELDIPIKRWSKSLRELPQEASSILIADPEVGPGRGELKALDLWVKNGGTLTLVVRPPNVFLEYFGLRAERSKSKNNEREVLFQPGSYTRGVERIQSKGHSGLNSDRPEWVFHLRDKWGGLLAVKNHGKGHVIALSDPILFSNGALREGDHAALGLNLLLTHRGEGSLLVDEYHHGYGRATSVLSHLGQSRAFAPFLQGMVLLLILWAGIGRRFGPPRSPSREETQTSMAYFKAIGQLFQRAEARNLALETSVRWIQDESKKLLVDKDPVFQKRIQEEKSNLKKRELTDRELLLQVRGLHEALEAARRKVS